MRRVESRPCSRCGGSLTVYSIRRSAKFLTRYLICRDCGQTCKRISSANLLLDVGGIQLEPERRAKRMEA
jgi:hypothetical protein